MATRRRLSKELCHGKESPCASKGGRPFASGTGRYLHDIFAGSKDGQRSNATLARGRVSVEGEPQGWGEQIFSRGGPQKQGNHLAGLLRTKGEH